jgi:hypothetical protein
MGQLGNRRAVIRQNISPTKPAGGMPGNAFKNARMAPQAQRQGAAGGGPSAPPQQQAAMPWDVGAANSEAGALNKRNNSMAGLQSGWQRSQQEFGLEGPWADYASNPYSRAALLQRSYDSAKRGTTNSAGHNLYAGSFINAQNQNTHQFDLGRDELQKGYDQTHAEYIASQQGAENEYGESIAQAGWDRVNAGLNSEPEPMPAGGPQGQRKPQNRKQQIRRNISPGRKAR